MAEQDLTLMHLPVPEPMPDGPGEAAMDLSSPEFAHIQDAIDKRGKAKKAEARKGR